MRLPAALAALVLLALSAPSAGAGSISGAFLESPAGTPLAAVEVTATRGGDSTVVAHAATAADGRFRLSGLASGRYRLRATLVGHEPLTRDGVALTDAAPDVDLGRLTLAVAPIALPGTGTSTGRATAIVGIDRNTYLVKDLPASKGGKATDVLRGVPELDVDIEGHVSLRGSSGVTIQFNGREAPMKGEALAQYLRQFPADRIEKVEVIANPSAKFDPEGAAGIINLVLEDKFDLGSSGSVFGSLGDRSASSGVNLAYQRGKVTAYGDANGYGGRNHSSADDRRENLLAVPVSVFARHTRSDADYLGGSTSGNLDYAIDTLNTLSASGTGTLSSNATDVASRVSVTDPAGVASSAYARTGDGDYHSGWYSGTLAFRHVVKPDRDEWSIEGTRTVTHARNATDGRQVTTVPSGTVDPRSRQQTSGGYQRSMLELGLIRPLGAKGKLEAGFVGQYRRNVSDNLLRYFVGDSLVVTPLSGEGAYAHVEHFQSGYLTAGNSFGRLSLQLGVRGEMAATRFDLTKVPARYDRDYRSVYPSANLAWDFGRGRVARFTYSKRIDRPWPYYLDPTPPSSDSLNVTVGNPYLGPRYTHSFGLDLSWSGSRGMLQLSPYLRRTVDNWDLVKTVDARGVATTTWRNASSVRFAGASFTASMRQVKRLGGTLNLSAFRESHDAGNLDAGFRRVATRGSASATVMFKVNEPLSLQGNLRYSPAQASAQGRTDAITTMYLGGALKVGKRGYASLWVNDPFGLWHSRTETRDAAHHQVSTNDWSMRSVTLSAGWSWGKPPEQQKRRRPNEAPPQEGPGPGQP
jgi:hypothetical protein